MNMEDINEFKEVRKKYQGRRFKINNMQEPHNIVLIKKVFNHNSGGFYCAYDRKDIDGIRKGQAFFFFEELSRIKL